MAALRHADGDVIIGMDDDGQTHPSQLGKLFEALEEGYDLVYGYYPDKKHNWSRNLGSRFNDLTVNAMIRDAGIELKELRVDGGAAANNVLMQFQADILNTTVIRPKIIETTALGAAYLAGLAVGYWSDIHEIRQHWHKEKEFIPSGEQQKMEELKEGWRDAVDRVLER